MGIIYAYQAIPPPFPSSGVVFQGGSEATSGLVGIMLLRHLCQEVSVFGIGSPSTASTSTPYQYYSLHNTQRSEGAPVPSAPSAPSASPGAKPTTRLKLAGRS